MIQETCEKCGSILLIEKLELNSDKFAVIASMKCPNCSLFSRYHSKYTIYSYDTKYFFLRNTYGREIWELLNFQDSNRLRFRNGKMPVKYRTCSPKYLPLYERNFRKDVPEQYYAGGQKEYIKNGQVAERIIVAVC